MKFILILMLIMTFANAKTTSGGYGACYRESDYDEWKIADLTAMKYLTRTHKCLILKKGLEYSVIDRGVFSSYIRIYIGNDSAELWTSNDNIR